MRVNKWTLGLAAAGLVSLPTLVAQAEEKANPVMTALSSTTISGYVDTSAHWVPGTGNFNPPPYIYNTQGKQDGFNLDKVKLRIEKPLDEATWAAGYRVDLLFGPDANIFNTDSAGFTLQDFAIQQAYVSLRAPVGNGLDFKMGVFDSIIGYESHDSLNDPNYTRSYATTMEPHTHTGLLATYQVFSSLGVAAGIADTMGPTIGGFNEFGRDTRAESRKTYLGSVAVTVPESVGFLAGSTVYGGIVSGGIGGPDSGPNQDNYYIGATLATPVKTIKVGASFDYVHHLRVNSPGGPTDQMGRSYAGYVSFQATEKLSFHGRAEYAEAFPALGPLLTPKPTDVFALTGTAQYDLWKNVLTRLEVRWDHAADGTHAFGGKSTGFPDRKNEWLLAANVIYKF